MRWYNHKTGYNIHKPRNSKLTLFWGFSNEYNRKFFDCRHIRLTGFERSEAVIEEYLLQALERAGELCECYDITIVIEPLNHVESNIIDNLNEGALLMDAVNSKRVRLLVDYYHYELEGNNEEILVPLCSRIAHVHFAELDGRSFPKEWKSGYGSFFRALKARRIWRKMQPGSLFKISNAGLERGDWVAVGTYLRKSESLGLYLTVTTTITTSEPA